MKFLNLFLLITAVFFINAQESVSFRSNSLGNAIDDDLDLVFDPIEIQFVEGVRLYTNLSNLTSNQEEFFDNVSDDEFLIGVSFKNSLLPNKLRQALLVRFENTETPRLNDGQDGTTSEQQTYYDLDDFENVDRQISTNTTRTHFDTENSYSIVLNNSVNFLDFIVGGKISLINSDESFNDANSTLGTGGPTGLLSQVYYNTPTFSQIYESVYLDSFDDDLNLTETGNFDTQENYSYQMFDFSFFLPDYNGYEFTSTLNYSIINEQTKTEDLYNGEYEYDDYWNEDENNYSETEFYKSNKKSEGTAITLGSSLRKVFSKQSERKNDGFYELSAALKFGDLDYTNNEINTFSSSNRNYIGNDWQNNVDETYNWQTSIIDQGSTELGGYSLSARLNIPLDKIHFGISAMLDHSTSARSTDYYESHNSVKDVDYLYDAVIGYWDYDYYYGYWEWVEIIASPDYTRTVDHSLTADRSYDLSHTTFVFPVGLEYILNEKNNLSMRFGSIFTNTSTTIDDVKEIRNFEPETTVVEYEDNNYDDDSIDVEDITVTSYINSSTTVSSSTVFTYGIGFNPTENLQIDLLGMGRGDFEFDGARISFTMKF